MNDILSETEKEICRRYNSGLLTKAEFHKEMRGLRQRVGPERVRNDR